MQIVCEVENFASVSQGGWNSTLSAPVTKTVEFTNIVDSDEVAHHELPHQDLHCLSSSL